MIFVCLLSMTPVTLWGQRRVNVTKIVWVTKPKILIISLFTQNGSWNSSLCKQCRENCSDVFVSPSCTKIICRCTWFPRYETVSPLCNRRRIPFISVPLTRNPNALVYNEQPIGSILLAYFIDHPAQLQVSLKLRSREFEETSPKHPVTQYLCLVSNLGFSILIPVIFVPALIQLSKLV